MLKLGYLLVFFLLVIVLASSAQTRLPDSVKQEISAIRKIEKTGDFTRAIEKTEPYLIKHRFSRKQSYVIKFSLIGIREHTGVIYCQLYTYSSSVLRTYIAVIMFYQWVKTICRIL